MATKHDPLRTLKIASPCPADWDAMNGDDRVRFCGQCELNVYNLSGMTRDEAERLLAAREGRVCVRYFRRADGTVLTQDCPVGLAKIRRRVARVAGAVAGFLFGAFTGVGATVALRDSDAVDLPPTGYERTMGTIAVDPVPPPPVPDVRPMQGEVVMGAVAPQTLERPPVSQPKAARRASAQ